jgi:hypothetical protein
MQVSPVLLSLWTTSYFQKRDKVVDVIRALVALIKDPKNPLSLELMPLLGVAIAVLVRLKHVEAEPIARLPQDLKVYFQTYSGSIGYLIPQRMIY